MARGFRIGKDGVLIAELDAVEREVLGFLLDELAALIEPEVKQAEEDFFRHLQAQWDESPLAAPRDPALARLFPDAFRDDAEASSDFRRFTEQNLRATKTAKLTQFQQHVSTGGPEFRLTIDEAHDALQVLTDLRLVLGTRLGIADSDSSGDEDSDTGNISASQVYDWLTWFQESLVRVMFQLPGGSGS